MRYDVYTTLAGNSGTRTFRRSFANLTSAKAYATRQTGYGILGTVRDRETDKLVFVGRRIR